MKAISIFPYFRKQLILCLTISVLFHRSTLAFIFGIKIFRGPKGHLTALLMDDHTAGPDWDQIQLERMMTFIKNCEENKKYLHVFNEAMNAYHTNLKSNSHSSLVLKSADQGGRI